MLAGPFRKHPITARSPCRLPYLSGKKASGTKILFYIHRPKVLHFAQDAHLWQGVLSITEKEALTSERHNKASALQRIQGL